MRTFYIDLEENKIDLQWAMKFAQRLDAEKVILIGSNAEIENCLRDAGQVVEVLPVGSTIPDGAAKAMPRVNVSGSPVKGLDVMLNAGGIGALNALLATGYAKTVDEVVNKALIDATRRLYESDGRSVEDLKNRLATTPADPATLGDPPEYLIVGTTSLPVHRG